MITHLNDKAAELIKNAVEHKENIILEQLGELITKELLVIEETQPVLVSELDPISGDTKLVLSQAVKLVLKDKEYIQSLEEKVTHYEKVIQGLKEALGA